MSGDVQSQPRKRKDNKKKPARKDDGVNRKESIDTILKGSKVADDDVKETRPIGVHAAAMGPDGENIHVHKDHGTGGNWCAKIVFFSLMAILLGIVGLIILENRGISDLETPVEESRFSEYFEGWVEDVKESHEEHHAAPHLDDHDEHDEAHNDHDEHDDQDDHDDHGDHDDHDDHDEHDEKAQDDDHEEQDSGISDNEASEEEAEDTDDNNNSEEVDNEHKNNIEEDDQPDDIEEEHEDNDEVDGNDTENYTINTLDDEEDSGDDILADIEEQIIRSKRHAVFSKQDDVEEEDDDDDEGFEEAIKSKYGIRDDGEDDEDDVKKDNEVHNQATSAEEIEEHTDNETSAEENDNDKEEDEDDNKNSEEEHDNEIESPSVAVKEDENSAQEEVDDNDESSEIFEEPEEHVLKKSNLVPKTPQNLDTTEHVTPTILEKQMDELVANIRSLEETLNKVNAPNLTGDPKYQVVNKNRKRESNKFEQDEDDSFEDDNVIDNDEGEDLHLEKLSKSQQETVEEAAKEPEPSSLAVKIIIGLALVVVASQVLLRKSSPSNEPHEQHVDDSEQAAMSEDITMRRRLTIADEAIADDDDGGDAEDYDEEYDDDEEEGEDDEDVDYEVEDNEEQETEVIQPKTKSIDMYDDMKNMYKAREAQVIPPTPAKPIATPPISRFGQPTTTAAKEDTKTATQKFVAMESRVETPVPKPEPKIETPPQRIAVVSKQPEVVPKSFTPLKESPPKTAQPAVVTPQQSQPAANVSTGAIAKQLPSTAAKVVPVVAPPPAKPDSEEEYEEEEEDGEYEDEEYSDEAADEEEEEVSDVDDSDLLQRLDAKYGKLSTSQKAQDDVDDEEEDEEDDEPPWKKTPGRSGAQAYDDITLDHLAQASNHIQHNPKIALKIFESLLENNNRLIPEAVYGKARALDKLAEVEKSNKLLESAIEAYREYLQFGQDISDAQFRAAAERCIERLRFRGQHNKAVEIHKLLIGRFKEDPNVHNQFAVTYLLSNRLLEAKHILHRTLLKWRLNGFALVNYGFVVKVLDKNLEDAVQYLKEGIDSGEEGTFDGKFLFHLGDALTKLGRKNEAMEVYKLGSEKNVFLSEYQRSLYNVQPLKSRPFWTKEQTTYEKYFDMLLNNWKNIRDEGMSILNQDGYFEDETEDLRDIGDWKQFNLFMRGKKIEKNCAKAPFTCKLIEMFPAARNCRRGQVKLSVMHPDTHVWPHCGPTNCRLRVHLGLKVPDGPKIRVANETRTWSEGELLVFDDSFEHEVWHNGNSLRLVLIIDVWHPDLSQHDRDTISAI